MLTRLMAHSSLSRKNVIPADVIPADSKPGKPGGSPVRFAGDASRHRQSGWIPARAALGRNDAAWILLANC